MFKRFFAALLLLGASQAQSFRAGAGKAEITPPPGFPTGGHGPAGDMSRGMWNRLHARAFYLSDPEKHTLILVSCDFFGMPLGLRAEVWKRLKQLAAVNRGPLGAVMSTLAPESLVISATHTHQGPGNYLSAEVYNAFGSRDSGFSAQLFDFLAKRIVAAVTEAIDNAEDAQIALYHDNISSDPKDQFVLNRSPRVFELNPDRDSVMDTLNHDRPWPPAAGCAPLRMDLEPKDAWDLPDCARLGAIDRRMTILKVSQTPKPPGPPRTLGVLTFFAVHPTVLLHSAPLYNSDFIGQALDELETEWSGAADCQTSAPKPCVVAGFFNGAEGDVTPRRTYRDILEVRERSRQFQDAVKHVLSTPEQMLQPHIGVRGHLIDMNKPSDPAAVNALGPNAVDPRQLVANAPFIGAAAIGGAEMDRTALYPLGWREGVHRDAQDKQGPKDPALDSVILPDLKVTSVFASQGDFPRYLPVVFAEIGNLQLGAVPVEMSTTAGLRIRKTFETAPNEPFQIIGLANEYASYTATESEYAAQDYMGASTLWGPKQAQFIESELQATHRLASSDFDIPSNVMAPGPPPRRVGLGWLLLSLIHLAPAAPFGPVYVGDRRELPDDGLQEILLNDKHQPERHLPYFDWDETIPNPAAEFDAAAKRRIAVLKDGAPFDADDADFIKILRQGPDDSTQRTRQLRRWSVIWLRPLWEKLNGKYVFQVTIQDTTKIRSVEFAVDMSRLQKICGAGGCAPDLPAGPHHPPALRNPIGRAR